MRINKLNITTIFSIALFLSSCVSPPSFHSDEVTENDILLNLKCEIARAINSDEAKLAWLKDYEASILLELIVINSNASQGNANLATPLNPGFATPKIAIGLTTQATRTINVKTVFDVADILKISSCYNNSGHILLKGDLGIPEYFYRVHHVQNDSTHNFKDSFYKIDFEITKSLTPSSTWTLIPVSNNIFGASASMGLTAKYTHKLQLSIGKKSAPAGKKVEEVTVVSLDPAIAKDIIKIKEEIERLESQKDAHGITAIDPKVAEERIKRLKDNLRILNQTRRKRTITRSTEQGSATRAAEERGLITGIRDN
jgi:hypothetical protein